MSYSFSMNIMMHMEDIFLQPCCSGGAGDSIRREVGRSLSEVWTLIPKTLNNLGIMHVHGTMNFHFKEQPEAG